MISQYENVESENLSLDKSIQDDKRESSVIQLPNCSQEEKDI